MQPLHSIGVVVPLVLGALAATVIWLLLFRSQVRGDVEYLQVQLSTGHQYVPLKAPNGSVICQRVLATQAHALAPTRGQQQQPSGPTVLEPYKSQQRQQSPRTTPSSPQPAKEKVRVTIPKGARAGQKVGGKHQGRSFSFKVPKGVKPGDSIKISIPAVQQQLDQDIREIQQQQFGNVMYVPPPPMTQIQYAYGAPPMSQVYVAPPMSQHGFAVGDQA